MNNYIETNTRSCYLEYKVRVKLSIDTMGDLHVERPACMFKKCQRSDSSVERQRKRKRIHVPHSSRPKEFVVKRNSKERQRVRAMAKAFDALETVLPTSNDSQKPSRSDILRQTVDYIRSLERKLIYNDCDTTALGSCENKTIPPEPQRNLWMKGLTLNILPETFEEQEPIPDHIDNSCNPVPHRLAETQSGCKRVNTCSDTHLNQMQSSSSSIHDRFRTKSKGYSANFNHSQQMYNSSVNAKATRGPQTSNYLYQMYNSTEHAKATRGSETFSYLNQMYNSQVNDLTNNFHGRNSSNFLEPLITEDFSRTLHKSSNFDVYVPEYCIYGDDNAGDNALAIDYHGSNLHVDDGPFHRPRLSCTINTERTNRRTSVRSENLSTSNRSLLDITNTSSAFEYRTTTASYSEQSSISAHGQTEYWQAQSNLHFSDTVSGQGAEHEEIFYSIL